MSKVVYLLGAGASFGTRENGIGSPILTGLPIVREIKGELENMINLLASIPLNDKGLEESKQILIKGFQKLEDACSDNATIDTYAKKLWLQGKKDEFAQVELLLTIFFILEQVIHKPDNRYDSFFANILLREVECSDELTLPDDIRILSWNYDNQLELVYRGYYETKYSHLRDILGIYDVKSEENEKSLRKNRSVIKLNGTANFVDEEDWLQFSDTNKITETLLNNILNKYAKCLQVGRCDGRLRLNFAWEEAYSKDLLENVIPQLVIDTTTLVVIGYSFPYFNRKIDRLIFENMPHLKKIYIQDKYPERIKQYITPVIPENRLAGIKIVPLDDVEQFYLPPEL